MVDAWLKHVAARGIRRLLCLLTAAELGFYEDDLLALFRYILHGYISSVYRSSQYSTHGAEKVYGTVEIMHQRSSLMRHCVIQPLPSSFMLTACAGVSFMTILCCAGGI